MPERTLVELLYGKSAAQLAAALAATPGSAACLPEYNESFGSGRRTARRPFP
jgi:hypothetical protein